MSRLSPLLAAALLLTAGGCDRRPGSETAASSLAVAGRSDVSLSPAQTIQRIHTLRTEHRYAELIRHLDPHQATGILDFLLAMDELIAAEREVQAAARQCPGVRATDCSLGDLANSQGVFSERLRVVSERVEADRAAVTIQIADMLPLETVELESVGGRWVYTAESPAGHLPEALRDLARAMRRFGASLRAAPVGPEQFRAEFRLRISPHLRRITELTSVKIASRAEPPG